METNQLNLFKYGSGQVPYPFLYSELQAYDQSAVGVVIHCDDSTILEDQSVHIYTRLPPTDSLTGKEVLEFEYQMGDGEETTHSRVLFVVIAELNEELETDLLETVTQLTIFLNDHLYTLRGETEDLPVEIGSETGYKQFTKQLKSTPITSFEDYLRELLASIGLSRSEIEMVMAYSEVFSIGLTDEDMNPNPLANYELLEFIGDLASWKPLNEIFLRYAEAHQIALTEPIITAFHRTYASKEKQAQIAKSLKLDLFLKKKGEITMDTYEDLFESLVGAMFYVSFHIRALLSIDLKLHERFLQWVYRDWDLSQYIEKPEITEFYEQMRILAGSSVFKELLSKSKTDKESVQVSANSATGGTNRAQKGKWILRYEKDAFDRIKAKLIAYQVASEKEIDQFLQRLKQLISKSYVDDQNTFESRRTKFSSINQFVKELITPDILQQMTNDKNTENWSENSKEELKHLISQLFPTTHYANVKWLVNERFVDKSKSNSYWLIKFDSPVELVISTLDYDESGNEETLLELLRDYSEGKSRSPNASITRLPFNPSEHTCYLLEEGKKWYLSGNPSAIENSISDSYHNQSGRFFLKVDGLTDREIEYNPTSISYFAIGFDWNYFRSLFIHRSATELPDSIYRYIGDRVAYGYTAMIAVMSLGITNVHHLTTIRNYYRSKELKKEVARLLDIRSDKGDLLSMDYLIGVNLESAERIITYLYMRVKVSSEVIYPPKKRLEQLRETLIREEEFLKQSLERKSNPVALSEAEKKAKLIQRKRLIGQTRVQVAGNSFTYKSSKSELLSIGVNGFTASKLKEVFEQFLLSLEQSYHPNLNLLRNSRFKSMKDYDSLKQVMEFRQITDWQISQSKKRGLVLRYLNRMNELVFISGIDLTCILKRI